jgi:hypothetical protein
MSHVGGPIACRKSPAGRFGCSRVEEYEGVEIEGLLSRQSIRGPEESLNGPQTVRWESGLDCDGPGPA